MLSRLLRRRVIIGAVLVIAAGGSAGYVLVAQHSSAPQYRTAAAVNGTVTQTLSVSGNLAPVNETNLDFTSSGTVTAVDVTVGQTVKAGTALATIDPTTLSTSLTQSQDTLRMAEVSAGNAQTAESDSAAINAATVAAAQATANKDCNATPPSANCAADQSAYTLAVLHARQSNDQSAASVYSADAQISLDQLNVATAQRALNQATLTSPVAGVVASVGIVGGQIVTGSSGAASSSSSATHAFVLITPGKFELTASVSDAQVSELALGQRADITPAGATEAVQGKVTSVGEIATVTSGVATFPVTITLTGSNPSLRSGMSATATIIINQVVDTLTVPTSAVRGGTSVEILVNGQPQTRTVTVGASDALRTQILSGLSAGDAVVIATVSSSIPSSSSGGALLTGGGARGGFGGGTTRGGGG